MPKIFHFCIIVISSLSVLVGCGANSTSNTDVELSPTFIVEGSEIQGIEGKIAIFPSEFIAEQTNKYLWHFWGVGDESFEFRVEAIDIQTGEKINPFPLDVPTKVLPSPLRGAEATSPSSVTLPKSGIWQLDAYVNEELFGSIIVEVN
ncbi:hypothetical protein BEP19_03340 [Ammoniphilus oxalaticus]|uniref:DUF4871 domain-containing protein n=1 Tax=Ammoniphilus oxalaticus TaxID=66863 RepID=A0A419SNZ9_9BACL|nr:DUF4871 domain-containing protein [Ammoniphilus oxalaticus]RKD25972.1 hypothetical protein BEP19_03340 [Ammoniphilus oxalaticus]